MGIDVGVPNLGVAVFETTTVRHVYLNGQNKASKSNLVTPATQENLCLGRLNDSTPNWEFDGDIWHACFWNRALNDNEVWALFDPETRWDLYYETGRVSYFFVPAAGAVPVINLVMAPYIPA